jgi:hypothetical protein
MASNKFFLREKRKEYTVKLEEIATPVFMQGISSLYDHVKKTCKNARDILKALQIEMRNIKDWPEDVLEKEIKRFKMSFPQFDKLIEGLFKIYFLTNGIRDTRYPSTERYVHECYLCVARQVYKNPFLLYDIGITTKEKQNNIMATEGIIRKAINDTFMKMLPFTPLDAYEDQKNSDDDEVEEPPADAEEEKEEEEVYEAEEAEDEDGYDEEEQDDNDDGADEEEEEEHFDNDDNDEEEHVEAEAEDVVLEDEEEQEEEEDVYEEEEEQQDDEEAEEKEEEEEEHQAEEVIETKPQPDVKVVNFDDSSRKQRGCAAGVPNVLRKKDLIKAKLLKHVQESKKDSFF